ncbi:MAG: 30S ribosomal protein S6 [Gomphosphaeria aponina SAG 52.96 = DSM 107014]|uniref:Small ribosomal subunit protein bS6 n=1 Tax=Gomphosphaeria aponina SAG 52.96 = DSM 107014 TaxID=1521640 RepID=A0A941JTS7_9CHRO|nr:30S ribosomal protein S6 [Gomphosphaeria aponina SAG 52.96 = DSM 107014]
MMTNYEMVYIVRPDLGEELVSQQINKYRDFLNQYGAQDLQIKVWGKRRLAYPIENFQDGIYVQMNYSADGKQVAPLERDMRLSEEIIRYLTIKLKASVSVSEESDVAEVSAVPEKPHVSPPLPKFQESVPSAPVPSAPVPSAPEPSAPEPSAPVEV